MNANLLKQIYSRPLLSDADYCKIVHSHEKVDFD